MEPKLTNVFHRTGEALIKAINGTGPRLIINQGGQGSSKTFSILQVIYNYLSGSKEVAKTTFCSYALPHLKQGVISDFDNIINSFGENIGEIKSSPSQPMYHIGKSEINCYGVEGNLAMAHGPRRKILFINECNRKITYEVFDQLFSRSEITFLDYNPDQEFWLHDKVLPNFPHVLIKSNFADNPYLPENELNNILMKRNKPGFENWWKVYGLGELGKLEGAIFTNWRYLKEGEAWGEGLSHGYGLDFGFNDPDAMVKVAVDHKAKRMYWDEKIYKEGNSFDQLRLMISPICNRNDAITADCADARMISQLSRYYNIKPVNKAKWTVAEALKMMQDYEHILTETSFNLGKEFNNYIWNDKKAGVPIDGFNHLIDAGRYRFQESLRGGGVQQWHY
jgi:phage terminase large subunit